MRTPLTLAVLFLVPSAGAARSPRDRAVEVTETVRFLLKLHDAGSGGFKADAAARPGLRATSGAVRALKYLGHPVDGAMKDKAAAFVMSCYDPSTGGFADAPGGKPDVPTTCIGVMAAVELEVPREKFRKAMDFIQATAKTWEEVRLGAAAVEAWGIGKNPPFDVKPWFEMAQAHVRNAEYPRDPIDGGAREAGSVGAMWLRLADANPETKYNTRKLHQTLDAGQRPDGGWGKKGAAGSDLETTYRVMRAYHLMDEKPKDVAKLREFIGKCRNADGGYGTKPGEKSGVSGVYYTAIVTKWLDELGK